MAKMFYSGEEAATQLGTDESGLKDLVRAGKLREFRDGGSVSYKVSDVDGLAPAMALETAQTADASASASGDIILEAVEDSGVELSPSMSDVISLEDTVSGQTSSGTTAIGKSKEDTVVPSVGVNVFDDDDMDEDVDPLAQTAISDLAGLGLEGAGSGSGILDLTRESDDTSLGKDLLSEIYTDDKEGSSAIEMGDATRAGLADTGPDVDEVDAAEVFDPEVEVEVSDDTAPVVVRQVIEYAPDAAAKSVTVMMAVGVLVMVVAFLAAAAGVRGLTPSLVETIYANLGMFAGGALGVALLASLIVYLISKRSE